MKLLEKFQKIKPIMPEGDDYEWEDIIIPEKDLETIKEVAELMNSLVESLDKSHYAVRRKLSPFVKETEYWSASSFDC